jgi:hypothetical protein
MGDNDRIFKVVEDYLHHNLPVGLQHFDPPQYSSNYLRIRYVDLPYSMYELHFAERSKHHAKHFGTGHLDLIAFYFGEGVGRNPRLVWLEEILPMKEVISEQLDMPVVIDEWGDNWVWIAACLQKHPGYRNAGSYASTFAKFLEETYQPVKKALRLVYP